MKYATMARSPQSSASSPYTSSQRKSTKQQTQKQRSRKKITTTRTRRKATTLPFLLSLMVMILSFLTIILRIQETTTATTTTTSTLLSTSPINNHLIDFAQQRHPQPKTVPTNSVLRDEESQQQQPLPTKSKTSISSTIANSTTSTSTTSTSAFVNQIMTKKQQREQQQQLQQLQESNQKNNQKRSSSSSSSSSSQHYNLVGHDAIQNLPKFDETKTTTKTLMELLNTQSWPTKTPLEMYGSEKFKHCEVKFIDSTMSTCHLGAFGGNFGDMIGPDIVKRILEYHFGCTSAESINVIDFYQKSQQNSINPPGPCLWTVGSIWRQVRPNDHVWGAGTLGKDTEFRSSACRGFHDKFNNVTVYSVRGPKTVELIELACPKRIQVYETSTKQATKNLTSRVRPYGDGGFLIPFLFPELGLRNNVNQTDDEEFKSAVSNQQQKQQEKHSCLILHKYDEDEYTQKLDKTYPQVSKHHQLLPVVNSWKVMANTISTNCSQVSSSSLHGIILADAYGIPAWWIQGSSSIFPFKFYDYFDSIGRTLESSPTLREYCSSLPSSPPKANVPLPYDHRSNYAKLVLESFPFHLFTTATTKTVSNQPTTTTSSATNDVVTGSVRVEEKAFLPPPLTQQQNTTTTTSTNVVPPTAVTVDNGSYLRRDEISKVLDNAWPLKSPRQLFGGSNQFDKCQVVFRDSAMSTCHLGAFRNFTTNKANFGDMLGPDIVKRIVEYYFGCSASNLSVADFEFPNTESDMKGRPCLWTVGSVWRKVRPNDHVWGTGSLGKETELTDGPCKGAQFVNNNITVYSVRGPKTVGWLGQSCQNKLRVVLPQRLLHTKSNVVSAEGGTTSDTTQIPPVGDAGFLIPFLFPELDHRGKEPEKESCVILHKYDEETFTNWAVVGNASMLPVLQNWETMYGNITQCRIVSSSSLHGLILADAYGIPGRYIRRSGSILKDKFDDYALSIEREEELKNIRLIEVFTDPDLKVPQPMTYNKRSLYATKILDTFPFHLFTTVGDDPTTPMETVSPMKHILDIPINLIESSIEAEGKLIDASNPRLYQPPMMELLNLSDWPTKTPLDMYGTEKFKHCEVKFMDAAMSTCHLGAFGGNFGDMIGPDIVKRIIEYRFGCTAENLPVTDFERQVTEGPCLWTVGSVWRAVGANDHVWGTGSLGKDIEFRSNACRGYNDKFNNVTVYSVRGPRSVRLIELACQRRIQLFLPEFGVSTRNLVGKIRAVGDAGFLIPFLFPELGKFNPSAAKNENCLILHKYDEEKVEETEQDLGSYHKRLPVIQPWQTMVGNLTQCQVVSSSSLHGLMLSDAYGIPARWIRVSSSVFPFKFVDYQESLNATLGNFGRERINLRMLLAGVEAGNLTIPESLPYPSRAAYAKLILESFPFHLFTTRPKD